MNRILKLTGKILSYIIVGLFFLFLGYGIDKNRKGTKDLYDQTNQNRASSCDGESVIKNFNKYMDSYFPDWEIVSGEFGEFGDFRVLPIGECVYNIQFYAYNPHFSEFGGQKDFIILQLSYVNNFREYEMKQLRGKLY